MATSILDEDAVSQLWPTTMALLILASMSASLLAFSPWSIDPLASSLSHFFTLFPLAVLATVIYIAKVKLDDEEAEVPGSS